MTGDIGGYVVITIVLIIKQRMIRGVVVILIIRRVAVIIIGIQIICVGLTLLDIHPQSRPLHYLSALHISSWGCVYASTRAHLAGKQLEMKASQRKGGGATI